MLGVIWGGRAVRVIFGALWGFGVGFGIVQVGIFIFLGNIK
jgi:hypothetical protein